MNKYSIMVLVGVNMKIAMINLSSNLEGKLSSRDDARCRFSGE